MLGGDMRMRQRSLLTWLWSIAIPSAALWAPLNAEGQRSNVTIRVTDTAKAPVKNAAIRLVPKPASIHMASNTDSSGQLALLLSPGSYEVFASAPGFKTTAQCVEVSSVPASVPIALQVGDTASPVVYPKDSLTLWANRRDAPTREPLVLRVADVSALPHITIKVHNGHSNVDESYSGVALTEVLARIGAPLGKELRGSALASFIVAKGADGYEAVLALAEVDPDFHPGQVIVADSLDGEPLEKEGPFKLIVTEDKHPARWVRNLVSIELHRPDR
jgi:Carboxypeptidase regulatory-like domain/Oxidoreductase molybdopterin binding domain